MLRRVGKLVAIVPPILLAACSTSGRSRAEALVDVTSLGPSIQVEWKGKRGPHAPLVARPAAEALARAAGILEREKGYLLLVTATYAPGSGALLSGSGVSETIASRGCAVDVSLYDPVDKREADMVEGDRERPPRIALADPSAAPANRAFRRELLRSVMESAGFERDPERWWRFTLKGCERLPVLGAERK